jgi:hypothetical protein
MTGRTDGARRRGSGPPRLALILVVAVGALLGVTGCQAAPVAQSTADAAPTAGPAPKADLDAIRATVDAVNATAGGPVADQQEQLGAHLDPARREEQRSCPTATTTLRLEPIEQGIRALPEPSSGAGTDPTGTAYALPTLIRIFSGNRLIGTDLTTLRLVVRTAGDGHEAYLTPFCVN